MLVCCVVINLGRTLHYVLRCAESDDGNNADAGAGEMRKYTKDSLSPEKKNHINAENLD